MEIHKPKAAHSWREFLIEIGTIVCGILIALGLEQTIEAVHWAEKVREAREAIHQELLQSTVFAEERINLERCRDAYLADLAAAVAASPSHWRPRPQTWCGTQHDAVFSGTERPWPTEVWRSIVSEGTVSHFPAHYRHQAPFTFNFIGLINERALEESQEASNLGALHYEIDLTPDAKIRFLNTITKLRSQNALAALVTHQLNGQIASLGETPTETELEGARAGTPFYRGGLRVKHGAAP
jgi:hypothetical protein